MKKDLIFKLHPCINKRQFFSVLPICCALVVMTFVCCSCNEYILFQCILLGPSPHPPKVAVSDKFPQKTPRFLQPFKYKPSPRGLVKIKRNFNVVLNFKWFEHKLRKCTSVSLIFIVFCNFQKKLKLTFLSHFESVLQKPFKYWRLHSPSNFSLCELKKYTNYNTIFGTLTSIFPQNSYYLKEKCTYYDFYFLKFLEKSY